MKKILFVSLFAVSAVVASAQVNKGQWLVGGNAGFESSKYGDVDNSKVTSFTLSPNAGYFFVDNFAGGLRLALESTKTKGLSDEAYTSFSLSPFLRYYFLPAAEKVNIFADASYGFGSEGRDDKESFNQFSIMAGPAVFLTPNTALEFAVGYKSVGGDAIGGNDRYNTIGLNIGFQIHLNKKK